MRGRKKRKPKIPHQAAAHFTQTNKQANNETHTRGKEVPGQRTPKFGRSGIGIRHGSHGRLVIVDETNVFEKETTSTGKSG